MEVLVQLQHVHHSDPPIQTNICLSPRSLKVLAEDSPQLSLSHRLVLGLQELTHPREVSLLRGSAHPMTDYARIQTKIQRLPPPPTHSILH